MVSPEEVWLPPSLLAQDTLGTKKYFAGFHPTLKENAQVLIGVMALRPTSGSGQTIMMTSSIEQLINFD